MSDQPTNGQTADPQAAEMQQPMMRVLGQFIRDMSFENALVQKGVQGEVQPEIGVEVSLDAKKRSPEQPHFEVISKYRVSSKNKTGGEPLFLLELEYGGIFHIENVPEAQLHAFLMIECPRFLFPFVRRIVADMTREGGFPPVSLDNVDFVALYRAELARRAEAESSPAPTPAN